MASGLSYFFSSPPHPTSNTWQRSTNGYYTPQQSNKTNWFASFTPTSPSPLRTSRNVNLMSSPLPSGNIFDKHEESVGKGDENVPSFENSLASGFSEQQHEPCMIISDSTSGFSTPFSVAPTGSTITQSIANPSFSSGLPPQPETSEYTLPSSTTSVAQRRASQFQFAARARSSSPATLLQSHTKETRDSRKRIFLDRLRSRRDEERTDRWGDQVERMDFLRERKRWEADKEGVRIGDIDADEIVDGEEEVRAGGLSPTMEDRDVEELARQYLMWESRDGDWDEVGMTTDFEDDGYDEVFMEVLSQQSVDDKTGARNVAAPSISFEHQQHCVTYGDADMDMS